MQVENETSGKYSTNKKTKSCSLKLEAHRLKAVGSSPFGLFAMLLWRVQVARGYIVCSFP